MAVGCTIITQGATRARRAWGSGCVQASAQVQQTPGVVPEETNEPEEGTDPLAASPN